jgi:hypothetical protein
MRAKPLPIILLEMLFYAGLAKICGLLVMLFWRDLLPFPSAESIGRNYLDRIIASDPNNIEKMANDNEYLSCIRLEALGDIAKYGGATVRNVRVSTESGTGSDDRLEWTIIKFDYQKIEQIDGNPWQQGKITIMTSNSNNNTLFRSIHCIGG